MNWKLFAGSNVSFKITASIFIISMLLFSCTEMDVYEKNIQIPGYLWNASYQANGSFSIDDTVSAYNLYVVLRHTDAYQYNNIWLLVGLQSPGDTMFKQKINLALGSDATGWEGSGMNDIWEVRKLLNNEPKRFRKKGIYQFSISQAMRDNPLPAVMSAGFRLEKIR